jgi:autotransporter-associated beta strand protein
MKRTNQIRVLLAATLLNASLFLPPIQAANKTWSGAGGDANWNTGANWGGTAPVNADSLIFNGATQQNNTNNISSLTVGFVTFSNGGFVLNGNTLTMSGSASAFFTNATGINTVANPLITTAPGGRYWFIAPNSELRLTGVVTNNAATGTSVGWLNLTNGGTVRIMNSAKSTRGMDLFQGTVIVDGSAAVADCSTDGLRFKPPTGSTVAMQITNNGTVRIGGGGNVRLGHNGTGIGDIAGAGSLSRFDISSGTLELYGSAVSVLVGDLVAGATGVFNQNGGLVWGSAGSGNLVTIGNSVNADGTYNLNGGVLWIAKVTQGNAGATNVVFNFNGGTLKPTGSSTTFMQGLLTANILSGGAVIDTTNLNITIAQSLAGTGSLKKLGTGTLVLSGNSTYTGSTVVSNGTLVLGTGSLNGGGSVVVADGATLSYTNGGGPLTVSSLTMGAAGASTLQLNFPNGNAGSASIVAGTLTGNGSIAINITGTGMTAGTFNLVDFTSGTGVGNFHLGSVPPGVSASLVTTSGSLQLNISSVVKAIQWASAPANNQWDTSSINWLDIPTSNPTNYAQSGGFGDQVTFSSSATTAINLTLPVTPVSITVDGSAPSYSFTGAGKISGVGTLTMNGFQPLTLGTVNDYSGGTTVNAGTIYAGADQALGSGAVTLNFGALASDSTTARSLSNVITQTANTGIILGDAANTGALILAGALNLGGGGNRTLTFNSDVVITGSLTNGGIGTKTGTGALIIKGNSAQTSLLTQQQGDVLVDGALFTCSDGWRLQNTLPGSTIRLVVTNGGVLNACVSVNTGNLRLGLAGGDNSANNILDVAGTINLTPLTGVAGNSAVNLGLSGANDILYLRPGGLLMTRSLFGSSPGNAEVHFMGGTIKAIANDTGFISGLTNAFMEDGGLTIDTTNFSVTASQALIASGTGGLTKTGTGTLTLTGTNTYAGLTVVNGGKLVLGPAHASPGGILVNANSTLAFLQSAPPATVNVPSVTVGSGANSSLEAQLSVTNAPAGIITNLILNGAVAVNVSGSFGVGQFPLFGYGTISGSGNLTLGAVPLGTIGHLVTNVPNKTIDLVVTSIALTTWTGAISGNWDTATTNWIVAGTPLAYAQFANVLFNDSASNASVNLTTTLTPSTMVVSNNALNYTFSGSGTLGGNMTLVKDGTNTVTLNTANTYTGNTSIKAGKLVAGNATAFGASTAAVTIQNGGSLDVNDNNLGAKPVVVGGSGVNSTGALINSGGVGQNNALLDVTLTTNTTIRADTQFGIRMPNETDPGFHGNGYKLTKIGTGTLALNGGQANVSGTTVWDSDLGDVDVQQGTLSFQRRMTMGRTNNIITVEAGANLEVFTLNSAVLPLQTKPVYLNNGTFGGTGNSAAEGNTFGGTITLASGTNFIRALADTTLGLLGPIGGVGSLYENSSAAGTVSLAATNTYSGKTVIQSGILLLQSTSSISNSSAVLISSNATFDVTAFAPWTLGAAQTLGGSGTVNGSVLANGPVAPGNSVGALTINGNLTLAGNLFIEVNKSLAQSNDFTMVSGTLSNTGTGSVLVTNLGSTLVVGDTFTLFSQPVVNGGALTVTGGSATWTNNLALDGSISVLTVVNPVNTNSVPITYSVAGGNVNLSWPTDHIGWRLQAQTNLLTTGLNTNWSTWPNSTNVNAVTIPVSATNPTVFFRLVYP